MIVKRSTFIHQQKTGMMPTRYDQYSVLSLALLTQQLLFLLFLLLPVARLRFTYASQFLIDCFNSPWPAILGNHLI
jgi:hypothetical protein